MSLRWQIGCPQLDTATKRPCLPEPSFRVGCASVDEAVDQGGGACSQGPWIQQQLSQLHPFCLDGDALPVRKQVLFFSCLLTLQNPQNKLACLLCALRHLCVAGPDPEQALS